MELTADYSSEGGKIAAMGEHSDGCHAERLYTLEKLKGGARFHSLLSRGVVSSFMSKLSS